GNRKDAGRRWITGTVGKKDPVGPQGEDRRRRAARRDDGDAAAETGKAAQDIVLDPVVHADDVTVREPDGFAIAALYGPGGAGPMIGLAAGHLARQLHAFEPGPLRGGFQQTRQVVAAVGGEGEATPGCAPVANA